MIDDTSDGLKDENRSGVGCCPQAMAPTPNSRGKSGGVRSPQASFSIVGTSLSLSRGSLRRASFTPREKGVDACHEDAIGIWHPAVRVFHLN